MLELFITSIIISISAFTYAEILTDTGMILFSWRGFWFRVFKGDQHFLFKIIVGCSYCVAGQWALWFYLYICIFGSELIGDIVYNPFHHLAFVMLTVFNVAIIKKAGVYDAEN